MSFRREHGGDWVLACRLRQVRQYIQSHAGRVGTTNTSEEVSTHSLAGDGARLTGTFACHGLVGALAYQKVTTEGLVRLLATLKTLGLAHGGSLSVEAAGRGGWTHLTEHEGAALNGVHKAVARLKVGMARPGPGKMHNTATLIFVVLGVDVEEASLADAHTRGFGRHRRDVKDRHPPSPLVELV